MIETLIGLGLVGLFVACFCSATVLPFSSDIVVVAFVAAGLDYHICLIVATAGGTLGGMVSYYLGRQGKTEWIEKKNSKVRQEKVRKIIEWINGKGSYMAFFSWFPIIGNLLIIALGYTRANVWIVSICLLAGMFVRYLVVIILTLQGIELFQ